ncbi:MAG: sugar transferase [Candidatus Hydrogenedentota bacterium]
MRNRNSHIARITPLIITDMLIAVGAFAISLILVIKPSEFSLEVIRSDSYFKAYTSIIFVAPFVRVFTYSLFGAYDSNSQSETLSHRLFAMCKAVSLGSVIIVVVTFMYRGVFDYSEFSYSRMVPLYDWMINIFAITVVHTIALFVRDELYKRGIGKCNVAIQGAGRQAAVFNKELNFMTGSRYTVKGFIATDDDKGAFDEIPDFDYLGSPEGILEVINQHNIDEVIVTDKDVLGMDLVSFVAECHKRDVVVKLALDIFGVLTHGRQLHELAGQPVIQVNEIAIEGMARVLKRTEDIILCSLALMITFPIWLVIGLLIKRESPGPAIFNQERVGKNGRTFMMYKFRSMYVDAEERLGDLMDHNEADSDGLIFKMKDDPRCTSIGRIIRRTNLDELPQFLNVIKGEMSLVGPRPPLPSEVLKYDEHHKQKLATTPGITGLWQVNRGHDYNFEELVNWDTYYIENWSLWLDIKIILKTIGVLLTGRYSY